MMELDAARFHWVDHLLFALTLILSAAIGIYYGFFDRQETTKHLFLGNKKMRILPVTLSILASFMSAISVLGTPSEIYNFGTIYFMLCLSYFVSFPLAAHVYMPIYHNLHLTSAHEYLERRFNPFIRYMVSVAFIIQMLFYMAIVIYAPALAFSQVSGLSMWFSILGVGAVCTFYTALGGMKAVMWTDVLQMLIAYGAMFAVIVQGCVVMGGFQNVWNIADQHGRIKFIDFNPDPLERHTLWTLFIGGATTTLTVYASNQSMVQRYLSMENLRDAQKAIYFALFATIVFLLMLCLMGLVMFAYYADCDPISLKTVTRGDQILPLYMLEIFRDLPGLPGLFLACVFSAALSTVSSGVNSLATVFLEDLIKPVHRRFSAQPMNEQRAALVSRILAVVFGAVTIVAAFMAGFMPSTLVQIALSIFGMVGGPILAVFTVGIFFPCVNSWGAGIGFICSFVAAFILGIGAILAKNPLPILPMSTDGCNITTSHNSSTVIEYDVFTTDLAPNGFNDTNLVAMTTASVYDIMTSSSTVAPPSGQGTGASAIFRLSYLYYSLVALVVCFVVAPLVSWITGCNDKNPVKRQLIYPVYDDLIKPVMRRLCCKRRYEACATQNGSIHEMAEEVPFTGNSSAASLCRREQTPYQSTTRPSSNHASASSLTT